MKVVKYWYAVLVLTLIVITYVIFIFRDNSDIETKLDEVKLKTEINEISKNSFAIMVEKEDGTGYEEVDSFPEGLPLNEELTGCIDIDGKSLDNAISYSEGVVTVHVNSTAYCYLYFDYNEPPTITSVTKTSDEQTSITVSVVASSDTTTYYYKIGSNDYVSSTSSTHTFDGLTKGTEYSISVYVVDDKGAKSSAITNKYNTKGDLLSEYVLNNPTSGLNTTLEGGLYRYQGTTNVNNYICFGTSDKDTCLNNTDAYMYRIIGITEDGKVKLIKNEAMDSNLQWTNDSQTDIPWPNSDLYKGLNGISGGQYSNLFIGNSTYMPSGWEDKIETTTWKYGDIENTSQSASAIYEIYNSWTNTINAKISIIYLHDYYYSLQSGGAKCTADTIYSNSVCLDAWMHLSHCDANATYPRELALARYGYSGGYYRINHINTNGAIYSNTSITINLSVRPVFYLTTFVSYKSGSGTSSDPFIIS